VHVQLLSNISVVSLTAQNITQKLKSVQQILIKSLDFGNLGFSNWGPTSSSAGFAVQVQPSPNFSTHIRFRANVSVAVL
jgi:hypothetical protein